MYACGFKQRHCKKPIAYLLLVWEALCREAWLLEADCGITVEGTGVSSFYL